MIPQGETLPLHQLYKDLSERLEPKIRQSPNTMYSAFSLRGDRRIVLVERFPVPGSAYWGSRTFGMYNQKCRLAFEEEVLLSSHGETSLFRLFRNHHARVSVEDTAGLLLAEGLSLRDGREYTWQFVRRVLRAYCFRMRPLPSA